MILRSRCRDCGTEREWEIRDGIAVLSDSFVGIFTCPVRGHGSDCRAPDSVLARQTRAPPGGASPMLHADAERRRRLQRFGRTRKTR